MAELSLEVVEGYAHIEGSDRMKMPPGVRGDHVEGLAAIIAPVSPLDACLHRAHVDDLPYPQRCHRGGDTLAGEDVV